MNSCMYVSAHTCIHRCTQAALLSMHTQKQIARVRTCTFASAHAGSWIAYLRRCATLMGTWHLVVCVPFDMTLFGMPLSLSTIHPCKSSTSKSVKILCGTVVTNVHAHMISAPTRCILPLGLSSNQTSRRPHSQPKKRVQKESKKTICAPKKAPGIFCLTGQTPGGYTVSCDGVGV
jgi:hypothetical protein